MEGFVDATLALLTDPVGLLIFASAMMAGLVSGIIPGLRTMSLAVVMLPFTVALSLNHTLWSCMGPC
jgi:TctA family transporter